MSNKVHKVYPPFYNGVSEQSAEMAPNGQCKEMINCVPDIVRGLTKRPPLRNYGTLNVPDNFNLFHSYDRGEGIEEYIFIATGDGDDPLHIYDTGGTTKHTVHSLYTLDGVQGGFLNTYVTLAESIKHTFFIGLHASTQISLIIEGSLGTLTVVSPLKYYSDYYTLSAILDGLATDSSIEGHDGRFLKFHRGVLENSVGVISSLSIKFDIDRFFSSVYSETYSLDLATMFDLKSYLAGTNLKALTVQDRTWIVNKDITVGTDTTGISALKSDYTKEAYYWIKRGSGDRYNPYNYAVYLDGEPFALNPNKPSSATSDPATGPEDSDFAAYELYEIINTRALETGIIAFVKGSILKIIPGDYTSDLPLSPSSLVNCLKISTSSTGDNIEYIEVPTGDACRELVSNDRYVEVSLDAGTTYVYRKLSELVDTGKFQVQYYKKTGVDPLAVEREVVTNTKTDFTFSSWDSWGDQASEGWKGTVNKITDLPKDMPFDDVYVEIKGTDSDSFTNYYVKWNGSSWEECQDPVLVRGALSNMPIKCDRVSMDGVVATFELTPEAWLLPSVGNLENNPDPSFVGNTISDLIFYKNRFGIVSKGSVVLTESATYNNFYIKTALDIVDTDPVDVSLATNQASDIYYAKPFNNSLFIFTKYSQYELTHEGIFSPNTVSIENVTNYPMDVNVEPVVSNNSLYFLSASDNRRQLREYVRDETRGISGVDLNIATPKYLSTNITSIEAYGLTGYVLCCTSSNLMYLYNYKSDGEKRIQSAWSKWTVPLTGDVQYAMVDNKLILINNNAGTKTVYNIEVDVSLGDIFLYQNDRVDFVDGQYVTAPIEASVTLPDFYPNTSGIANPKDKMLLKKVIVEGEGDFDGVVYRKDYGTTYTKSHTSGMADLDLHVNSKVGNVDIIIQDNTDGDFRLTSVVVEGIFNRTSREIK